MPKQKSILLVNIDSLERDADYDKKVAETEWPDLMFFVKNQLTEIERGEALLRSLR